MRKNKIEKNKTSIQDIKISENREKLESSNKHYYEEKDLPPQSKLSFKKKNKKKWPKVLSFLLIFIITFSIISIFFHSVDIKIKPKTKEIIFKDTDIYTAIATKTDNINIPNSINYELFNFSFSTKKMIDSIGVEEQKEKATGKIKIINNSHKTQKLRKETRFRNGNKIFMTYKSTTIPANSSVIVDAFATEAGEGYNLPVGTKFDIPGFEEINSPLFTQMSGEISKEFTGGLIGKTNVPDKNALESAKKASLNELNLQADQELINKIPTGYILVDSKSFRKFSHKISSQENKVVVNTILDIQAIIFKESEFIKMISGLTDTNIAFKDISNLNFKILSKENLSVDAADDFEFNLTGKAKIYWKFDQKAFIAMIKGHSKKDVEEKLKDNFKDFDVKINFRPFWRSSVPNNINNINIEIIN